MSRLASLRLLALPAVLLGAVTAIPGAALADEPLASVTTATAITADAGVAAWRTADGRVVVRIGDGAPVTTKLRPPTHATLDVGPRSGGKAGAQLAWASGCAAYRHHCSLRVTVLTADTVKTGRLTVRTVAFVPYGGGDPPAVAVEGNRMAYSVRGTVGRGRYRIACDVPYVRTTTSSGRTTTRKLDRGHCAAIDQLDLGEGRVALLAAPTERGTEARMIKVSGGRSRTLQAESQGEESNYLGAVSLDRGALYTARGGIRQANVFTRFSLKTYKKTEARAFVSLVGPFARDGGRQLYTEQPAGGSYSCQSDFGVPACLVVAGADPFAAGERTLPTELKLLPATQPMFIDTPHAATVTATRRRVTATAQVASDPVAGLPVELLSSRPTRAAPTPMTPTGATGTTGADGTATIAIPGAPVPRLLLAAVSRPASPGIAVQTADTFLLQSFAHLTAVPERLANGRLRITGTISPALPGRKVRLDRRLERNCKAPQYGPKVTTPSTVETPAGCVDRWSQNPLATAVVSADGASYAIEAATPADVYRVNLDFAGGADVFPGETGQITAP